MSLYAIGDLHLHFEAELKNKAQLTDPLWRDHERRLMENCRRLIRPEDTLVLVGDHSWGRKMAECERDFDYIRALPGRKILLRGNHDMFWDVNKTTALNEQFKGELFFLQNNYAAYGDIALAKNMKSEAKNGYKKALRGNPPNADEIRRKLEAIQAK